MTQEHLHNYVKHMLSTDRDWALRALVKIYERQTSSEKAMGTASVQNGIGFTGVDAEFLGGMAKYYISRGSLTDKQLSWVMKKMHKYHSQIIAIADREKLEAQAAAWTP